MEHELISLERVAHQAEHIAVVHFQIDPIGRDYQKGLSAFPVHKNSKGLFILGYPGETAETIEITKAFIRKLPISIMNLTKFTPYPGSPIYKEMYGTAIRDDHWQKMNGMNFLWAPEGMTVDDLDRYYQEVLVSFYVRPRMTWYYTKLTLRYPAHLARLSRFLALYAISKTRSLLSGRKGLLLDHGEQAYLDRND